MENDIFQISYDNESYFVIMNYQNIADSSQCQIHTLEVIQIVCNGCRGHLRLDLTLWLIQMKCTRRLKPLCVNEKMQSMNKFLN